MISINVIMKIKNDFFEEKFKVHEKGNLFRFCSWNECWAKEV